MECTIPPGSLGEVWQDMGVNQDLLKCAELLKSGVNKSLFAVTAQPGNMNIPALKMQLASAESL